MSDRALTLRPFLQLGLVAFLIVLSGCGGGSVSSSSASSIQITGGSSSLAAGQTMQLTAIETAAFGKTSDVTSSAVWTSANTDVATVSSSGLVTGLKAGSASLSAKVSTVSGSFSVTIGAPAITRLTLSPANASIMPLGTQAYAVTATYANNTSGALTSGVQWSVLPASVATIGASGVVTGVATGSYVVLASVGSVSATASGTVIAPALSGVAITPANASLTPGGTQQFKATGSYSNGTKADLSSTVAWSSGNISLLTIDANGLATASASATSTLVTVSAQLGSITSSVTAHVAPAATLTSLFIEPTSSSIVVGSAEPHVATAYYSDGSQKDVTHQVVWSVGAGSNARRSDGHKPARSAGSAAGEAAEDTDGSITVTQTGTDTAVAPGTSTIQATLGGMQTGSTVIVTNATVTKLEIRATKDLFPVGSIQPVQLIGTFSDGSSQDLSLSGNWKSSDNSIATIDDTGLATGIKAGDVQFSASFGGLTASTVGYQVLPTTLVSTIISTAYPTQALGVSEQLHLLGAYSDGTVHDLTSLATWQSNDPSIYSVNSEGIAYALTAGTTQIIGTVLGNSAIIDLTGSDLPLLSMDVGPENGVDSFALGTTLDIVALGQFGNGNLVQVNAPSIWHSSNPAVLTIDGNGRAKSGSVGQTTVSATLLGITQFSQAITVTSATLASLRITPGTAQVGALTGQQYTAIGTFSDGSVQDLTADLIWNTSDNTIASIDANGFAIGMRAGQVQISGSFQGQVVTAPLTVTSAMLVSVAISPGNSELPLQVNKQFSLIGTFSDGTTEDLSSDAVWSTSTPEIIAEFLQGNVVGLQTGVGVVTAERGYFSASTNVNITNATLQSLVLSPASTTIREGQQQLMTLIGTFSDGYTQNLNAINGHIYSSNTRVAAVGESAIAYGVGVGSATITGAFLTKASTTTKFQVLSNVLSSLVLGPADPVLAVGGTQQLTATGTYTDGSTADVSQWVNWSSSNPEIVSVNQDGLAWGVALGTATITAQSGETSQSFTVTVDAATPSSPTLTALNVVPTSGRVAAGTTERLTALGSYSDGSQKDLTTSVLWSSASTATATVNNLGVVTGVSVGDATVLAQSGVLTSSSTVVVTRATLTSVAISPAEPALRPERCSNSS